MIKLIHDVVQFFLGVGLQTNLHQELYLARDTPPDNMDDVSCKDNYRGTGVLRGSEEEGEL